MKPEQQRITIAEACGWELKSDGSIPMWSWRNESLSHRIKWSAHKEMASQGVLPDYLNDLNAMHDAWLKLPPSEKERFESELYSIVIGEAEFNRNDDAGWITNATAEQRAKAFIKTLNLWKP